MSRYIIDRLLSYPQRGQIEVNFDLKKRAFRLSIPIFSNPRGLPQSVKKYIESRKDFTFKPHATSFQFNEKKALLIQEIPFSLDFQETLRAQMDQFWKMSQTCHQMLSEIAIEEKYEGALNLF